MKLLPSARALALRGGRRALAVAALGFLAGHAAARSHTHDVVVYGGTPSGVITAVAAARQGARVALLEPRNHLGGMVSGGLSLADVGRPEVVGGYALEFFERAGRKYGVAVQWRVEPHVAESIFREMAKEADVATFFRHRLRERGGVTKKAAWILSISTENGSKFTAKVFIDATYEGDLMASAGVGHTWGRESADQYEEDLAGVRAETRFDQFAVPIRAYDKRGRLLPEVSPEPKGPAGSVDKKIQAYNFRLCMTQEPANRVPFPRPKNYDPRRYAILGEVVARMWAADAAPRKPIWTVLAPREIPRGKTDTNGHGGFSLDYVGGNYDYPNGNYKTRARIWQAHIDYQQGLLYFLQHDPGLPPSLRSEMTSWGLCKDEFVDTDHWPHQLYVREARRMLGGYVMTQHDVQVQNTKPDAIAMGSFPIDSHTVQRIVSDSGHVENEGGFMVQVQPYQIPYRVLLPRRTQAVNLLVPVCVSATHVAYSSLRMEPVYMSLGHAAGLAAKLAIDRNVAVQDVDVNALVTALRRQRAVIERRATP